MAPDRDTIFAKATGAGKAGIAVIRVSGPESFRISDELIGKRINIREATLAEICDPFDGALIDRGLVIMFQSPASFTGEDTVEFHLHGSAAVEACLFGKLTALGARPAEAGEFTLRAFRNGRLDLAQAEALADLIDAETNQQRKQALGQLGGRLSQVAEDLRAQLLSVLTPLEADIDFPDEGDVPAAVAARAGPAIAELKNTLTAFLATSGRARKIRKGIKIAIIGPPNAGKSSLVNALAGADVAIVSDIAGTTRDVVEARLDLGGILATLSDTAGLRDAAEDAIEAEGMARARSRAEEADLRVAVFDPRAEFVSRETLDLLRPGDFLVWTHADLEPAIPSGIAPAGVGVVCLSPVTGLGVAAFIAALTAAVAAQGNTDAPALTRARHVRAVEDAIAALTRAEQNIETAPELAAEDARLAARALGGITGAVGAENVLGEIFSSFCIGK